MGCWRRILAPVCLSCIEVMLVYPAEQELLIVSIRQLATDMSSLPLLLGGLHDISSLSILFDITDHAVKLCLAALKQSDHFSSVNKRLTESKNRICDYQCQLRPYCRLCTHNVMDKAIALKLDSSYTSHLVACRDIFDLVRRANDPTPKLQCASTLYELSTSVSASRCILYSRSRVQV